MQQMHVKGQSAMAIHIPKPTAKTKTTVTTQITSQPVNPSDEPIPTGTVINQPPYNPSPAKTNRLIMMVASLLMLMIIGMLVVTIGLPAYKNYLLRTEKTQPNPTAPVAVPVAKPEVANVVASQPNAPKPTEQLNQQTIVITGEQLGNGVPPASTLSSTSAQVDMAPSAQPPSDAPLATSNTTNLDNPSAMRDQPSAPANNNTQSSLSYEEFIKTSQQTVFVDR